MPVWHERTRAARESGELLVVGLTQEQHPARCKLFAQWHSFDWPILWDPFNLSGSAVVPRLIAIDEHGIVRATRLDGETWERDFLHKGFDAKEELSSGAAPPSADPGVPATLKPDGLSPVTQLAWEGLDMALWGGPTALDAALANLAAGAGAHPDDAAARFRLGVAHRMRFDSAAARPGDFQRALDEWRAALDLNPNQYIWRRRIQQYGPRLDKPYPFYDWVTEAMVAIDARGEEPVALRAPLSGAERAAPQRGDGELASERNLPSKEDAEPDPDGRIERNDSMLVIETAVAPHTSATGERSARVTARVHVALRPNAAVDAHWNNEVEPALVWIGAGELPAGITLEARSFALALGQGAVSGELRTIDFEIEIDLGTRVETLPGYVLFHGCTGRDGACVFRRADFEIPLGALLPRAEER